MHQRNTINQVNESEIRERLDQIGYVVVAMSDGIGAGRGYDLNAVAKLFSDHVRDIVKGGGNASGGIE